MAHLPSAAAAPWQGALLASSITFVFLIFTCAGGVVTELDPDAPARQGRLLHPDNAKAEERITFRLWQLMRSGVLEKQEYKTFIKSK